MPSSGPPPTAAQPSSGSLASAPASARSFVLLWAASILIPLAVFAAAAVWSWSHVGVETQARLGRTVDMLHEHALRSFETQEAVLEAIDQRVRGLSWAEIASSLEIHEFLAALSNRTTPSGGTVLVDPSGRIALGSYEFPARPVAITDREYFREHKAGRKGTFIGEVIVTRPQNTKVFSISRPRTGGASGEAFDGLVVSSFKPNYFEDFYRAVAETPGDVIGLVRDDGALLVRSPPPADLAAYQERLNPRALQDGSVDGRRFTRGRSPVDGRERLYLFKQVGAYPVYVLYGLNASVLRDDWLGQLLAPAVACALAAACLVFFTTRARRAVEGERAALAAAEAEALRRVDAEGRLHHAQRVDALGQIVGGVAHDFNNVVMAVIAGVRSIDKRAEDPVQVRRIARMVQDSAERGSRLTSRMLAFARREETRSETVEVGPALRGVAELLGGTLGGGYEVRCVVGDDLPVTRGDRTEFESVVVNLVINARDAMPEGGTVEIAAHRETVGESSGEAGLGPGSYARVSVADQGSGMDAATLARAGEAFFTTKPSGQGTGLGLATARGFAEHAGGMLTIASEEGRGTTVTLWLAASAAAVPEPAT